MPSDYEIETRPSTILDEWLVKFGMDKNRRTDAHMRHMSYVRVRDTAYGMNTSRWILGGVAGTPAEALAGSFEQAMQILRDAEGLGVECPNVDALVLMSHGQSMYVFLDPKTGEQVSFDQMSEEGREQLRLADEKVYQFLSESESDATVRARLVTIITESGLAADVSNWINGEVSVDRAEKWTGDGEHPQSGGALDDALMATFTMLHLVQETIRRNYEVGFDGLVKCAMELAQATNNGEALAFLLRVIATGVESGLLHGDD